MGKLYRGHRGPGGIAHVLVVKGRKEATLPLRYGPGPDQVRHTPHGFEYGERDAGVDQLAFALAFEILQDSDQAHRVYQSFKRAVIAALDPDKPWEFSEAELRDILAELLAAQERETA